MSEHNINIPKIRFPGFIDAWEKRRLVDVADYRNGKAHEQEINEDGEYIVVNSKFVSTDGRVKKYSNALIEPLKTGEIAFVLSDVPNGKAIARTFLVDENNKYSLNQRIAGITPHEDTDSYFLSVLMNRNNYFLKFDNGVGQTNLSKSEVENFSERYPSYEEQVKVGTLFRNLDSLITIHQRKLNHLQERKKGLLQKMFPKNGEDFPELRFPGYTEAWEQQKFSDMLDSSDGIRRGPFGSALKKDFFVPKSDYVVYEQQNAIYDKYETRYNITKEKFDELHRFVVYAGDFIMSGAGTIGRISRVPEGIKQGVFNQALIRMKINPEVTDSEFFLQWMRSNDMQRKLTQANPASAMVNLVPMSEVKEWEVMVPEKAEQAKLGEFFSNLDRLITLHQRKLEHLQKRKKALLQQMFV
jgi:type I restriction enzyme S subunit